MVDHSHIYICVYIYRDILIKWTLMKSRLNATVCIQQRWLQGLCENLVNRLARNIKLIDVIYIMIWY